MHRDFKRTTVLSVLTGALLMTSMQGCVPCRDTNTNDNDTQPGRPIPVQLNLSAATFTLTEPGQQVQLTVESVSSDGNRTDVTRASTGTRYFTTSEGVITVSPDGLLTAVDEGQTTLVVVNAGLSARRRVRVDFTEDVVVRLEVSPTAITFTDPTEEVQLIVTGIRNNGQRTDLSASAAGTTYVTRDPAVVAVSPEGRVTPVADGVAGVEVRNANLTAKVDVTVRFGEGPPPGSRLVGLSVTPSAFTLTRFAQTQQLEVLGVFEFEDARGQTRRVTSDVTSPNAGTTYRTSNAAIASVNARGLVTAVLASGQGQAEITVENDGIRAVARVTVNIPPDGDGGGGGGGGGEGGGGGGGGQEIALGWTLRPLPEPRNSHALAFDALRNVTVLFGGYGSNIFGGTWVWDGSGEWRVAQEEGHPNAPSPRYAHAMTFDSRRGVVVLFGGTNGERRNAETWEWNGTSWTLAAIGGPAELSSHAMAYDSARGVTVLFGGSDNNDNLLGETWEWDGVVWARRDGKGISPAPRIQTAMAYDAARGLVVLFGGDTVPQRIQGEEGGDEGVLNDTWGWNGQTWTLLDDGESPQAPAARKGHAMCYDAIVEQVVMHGGGNGVLDTRSWRWNGASWQPIIGPSPGTRISTAMAYDVGRRAVILFGGFVGNNNGEVWELQDGRWSLRADSARPSPRHLHTMTFDNVRGRVVLFGGSDGDVNRETWEYDGRLWNLRSRGGPSARVSSAMIYDASRQACVLFGGQNDVLLSDTWTWNGARWTQLPVGGPTARYGHALAYDAVRGQVVLFGGSDQRYNGETWVLGSGQWTLASTTGPQSRIRHAMTFDSASGKVLLYGGFNNRELSDTWSWDGRTWTLEASSGPPPRSGHTMVFDTVRRVCVMFGGRTLGNPSEQTWVWGGQRWVRNSVLGPSGRYGHGMAYDPFRATFVLFGGYNGPVLDDTWELTGPR